MRSAVLASAWFFAAAAVHAQPAPSGNGVVPATSGQAPAVDAKPGEGTPHPTQASATPPSPPAPNPVLNKWNLTIYGLAEVDVMHDSTQSFPDAGGVGSTLIRRKDTTPFEASNGRTIFTVRNSRLGFRGTAPEYEGMRGSAVVEMDFYGGLPTGASEGASNSMGTFRTRLAYVKVESDYIDVLGGQTYYLFGSMPFFYPCTSSFFPTPNQGFGRQAQIRLSHTFKTDPIDVDLGVAAVRPPQGVAEVPDFQGALKVGFNGWKGIHSLGAGTAMRDALTLGVSGTVRQFRVNALEGPPTTTATSASGYGLSLNAFIPVIPTSSAEDRGNALSLTGSFITGTGIGDLGGFVAAPAWPAALNPNGTTPAPTYTANIDNNGMVMYTAAGVLHTIDWHGFMAGAQYYLPPSGRFYVGVNYTWGETPNMLNYLSSDNYSKVVKESRYIDATLFFDVTPVIKTAILYGNYHQIYGDGYVAENHRAEFSAYYYF